MGVISLVGTLHQERGRVNSFELDDILRKILPEVIFIEAPASIKDVSSWLSKAKPTESLAISKYLDHHAAKIVPVDLLINEDSYLRNPREVIGYVEKVSGKYCQLFDQDKINMIDGGFAYLNSEPYQEIKQQMDGEIQRILGLRKCPSLDKAYSSWLCDDERREIEMLSNIELYCRQNSFERAVFLVGAAHRASIVSKSMAHSKSGQTNLQWDYSSGWCA
ncbi:MAG: hypothetical protein ACRERR_02030 [Moraxellaceae bacterium]